MNDTREKDGTSDGFRSKWVAGLLGLLTGSIGLHRMYLGLPYWWLYGLVFVPLMAIALQAEEWFREPTFFVASIVTLVALFETIKTGLTPAEQWDARFNANTGQKTRGGALAVVIAVVALMAGAILSMSVLAIFLEGFFLSGQKNQ